MKQVYYHYTEREDFKNGMYNEAKEGRNVRVRRAIAILTNLELLYELMSKVTTEWIKATQIELTNPCINHRAWLGQSACNIDDRIKEDEVREAWGYLTDIQRIQANKVADRVYSEWEHEYTKGEENYQYSLFD